MLIEKIENINLDYKMFNTILEAIENKICTNQSIEQYCSKVKNLSKKYFNEHIEILRYIKLIDEKNIIFYLTKDGEKVLDKVNEFNKKLLEKMKQDGSMKLFVQKFINEEQSNNVFVSNSTILYKYSGLRNFFINTGVFIVVNDNLFKIYKTYIKYFVNRTSMSIEMLEKILENEKKQGEIAEKFVLDYERKRLKDKSNKIKIISNKNTLAGYDIISYKSKGDTTSIYIEVKSYSGNRIFITSNEIEKAKEYGELYYIYMVNIKEIENIAYEPRIIQNPYKNIILSDKYKKKTELISIEIEEN